MKGEVVQCKDYGHHTKTIDAVNLALQRWKQETLKDDVEKRPDTILPLSSERLDIVAYTYLYHMNGGYINKEDPFWGSEEVRKVLLTYRFDEHMSSHHASCFKKGGECRFLFPFNSCDETHIHEDRGIDDEHIFDWHVLMDQ